MMLSSNTNCQVFQEKEMWDLGTEFSISRGSKGRRIKNKESLKCLLGKDLCPFTQVSSTLRHQSIKLSSVSFSSQTISLKVMGEVTSGYTALQQKVDIPKKRRESRTRVRAMKKTYS